MHTYIFAADIADGRELDFANGTGGTALRQSPPHDQP